MLKKRSTASVILFKNFIKHTKSLFLYSVLQSHVKEASGDRGQNTYKYLEWPGVLEVHACGNHQGAEKSQPRVL